MAVWTDPDWGSSGALTEANFDTKIGGNLTYLKDLIKGGTPIEADDTNTRVGIGTSSPLSPLHVRVSGSGNPAIRFDTSEATGDYLKITKFDNTAQFKLTHDDGNSHWDFEAAPNTTGGDSRFRLNRNSTIDGDSGLEIYAADGTTTVDYFLPPEADGSDAYFGGHGGISFAFGRTSASSTFHIDSGSGNATFRLQRAGNTNQNFIISRTATATSLNSYTQSDAYLQFNGILDGNNNADAVYYDVGDNATVHGSGNQVFRFYDGDDTTPGIDSVISMHSSSDTRFHSSNTGTKVGWWKVPQVKWEMAGGNNAIYAMNSSFSNTSYPDALTVQLRVDSSDDLEARWYRADGDYTTAVVASAGSWTTP